MSAKIGKLQKNPDKIMLWSQFFICIILDFELDPCMILHYVELIPIIHH